MVGKKYKLNEFCTIYLLTNKINSLKYTGQTWGTTEMRMGDGERYSNSPDIYRAILEFGVENFAYQELAYAFTQAESDKLEDGYMDLYNTLNPEFGYNRKRAGSHGKHLEQTKQQISQTLKEQWEAMAPQEQTERTASISTYWLGKKRGPHTQEWKDNNSEMMKKRHAEQGHPMQGKHHTEKSKQKISAVGKGRKRVGKWDSGKPRTPPDKEQNIIHAYQQGLSISNIASQFDVGQTTIRRILKRNNISQKVKSS